MGIEERKLAFANQLRSLEQRRQIVESGLRDIRTRLSNTTKRIDPATSGTLIKKQQQLEAELLRLNDAISNTKIKLAIAGTQNPEEIRPQPERQTPAEIASSRPAPPPVVTPPPTPPPGGPAISPEQEGEEAAQPPNQEDESLRGSDEESEDGGSPPQKDESAGTTQPATGGQPDTSGGTEPTTTPPGEQVKPKEGAAEAATDATKKIAADSAKKKATKEVIWKFIMTYGWWILLIILIIGIAITLFAVFYSMRKTTGKDAAHPTDVMADQDAVVALALKSGVPDIASEVAKDVTGTMIQNLTLLKNSIPPTNTALLQKIDDLIVKINQGQTGPAATEIPGDFQTIMQEAANFQAPQISAAGTSPVLNITGYNEEIHFGTPLHKEMPSGSATGHATYMHYGEGTADAVDLYVNTGADVLAPIAGQIVDLSDDGTGHKKIVINQGDYELLIAFVDPASGLTVGQSVTAGTTKLGTAAEIEGQSQIHLELAYCGKNVTLVPIDRIKSANEGKAIGQYLWERFKFILNIP